MAEKRRGLGRGLGALIPGGASGADRPVDVFFPGAPLTVAEPSAETAPKGEDGTREDGSVPSPSQEPADRTTAAASTDGTAETGTDSGPAAAPADSGRSSGEAAGTDAPREDVRTDPGSQGTGRSPAAAVDEGPELVAVPGAHFAELPVDQIRPNPRQPRTVFDEDALAELASSIGEIGVLQPVVVRPSTDPDGPPYELIMGERRWRATQEAGLDRIPAIVRETEDHDLLRDALLENLHRSQLNPLEEAAAYQQLLDDFGCTHDDLATRIHRSRPQITNTIRLLRLPPLVQRRVAAGVLSAGHARALLGLPDAAAMERLAQRIVAEGLSVRATEEIVSLGGEPERATVVRRPRPGGRNTALEDLAVRLSDRLDTRVKIALGKSKGRMTVEFASVEDLNRILDAIAPDDPGVLRRPAQDVDQPER